jgi:hypothetical protein
LKAQFADNLLMTLPMDNAGKFTSETFDDFCSTAGIDVQYPVPHVHFQNGIAKSLIKRIQMVAGPLLMQANLPASAWGHAVLHSTTLLQYRPSAFNDNTPHHLAFATKPSVTHIRVFGCQVLCTPLQCARVAF